MMNFLLIVAGLIILAFLFLVISQALYPAKEVKPVNRPKKFKHYDFEYAPHHLKPHKNDKSIRIDSRKA